MVSGFTAFLSELRRRRVFRVAVVYAGVAFIIFQVADFAFPALHVPDWFSSAVVVLLALGFLVAVGLAWAFDITDKGIVRTKGQVEAPISTRPLIGNTALGIVAALAILVAAWSWFGNGYRATEIRSIAVLPLANLMNDPDQEYFVDGMHEAMITALSKIPELRVIGRTSVMGYRENPKPIPEIGRELGVDAVVEGSILREGNNVRITAQLVGTRPERHIWANQFDRTLEGILQLHNDVAKAIAEEIKVTLTLNEEAQLASARQVDPEAYELFLRAKELVSSDISKETLERALDYLSSAVRLDSLFVEAYAEAARQHMLMYVWPYDPTQQRLNMAKQALDTALQLAPNNPAVLTAKGRYHHLGFRDYTFALIEYNRALALAPSNAVAYNDLGFIHFRLGDFEAAFDDRMKAFELDPRSAMNAMRVGQAYRLTLKDLANTQVWYEHSLNLNPELAIGYIDLANIIFLRTGQTKEALAVLEDGDRFADSALLQNAWTGLEFQAGRYAAALEHAATIPEIDLTERPKTLWMGILYNHLGHADSAEQYLYLALEQLTLNAKSMVGHLNGAFLYVHLGLTHAYLGQTEEALAASTRAYELMPLSKDAYAGVSIQRHRAHIFTVLGQYDKAMDILEDLLARPGSFVINELLNKREWEPLRSHPRYAALLAKYREQ